MTDITPPQDIDSIVEKPHTRKHRSAKLLAIITASTLAIAGGVTLTAVSIANAETQSRVDAYKTAVKKYNTTVTTTNKTHDQIPEVVTQLTTSANIGAQHVSEMQKFFAAEAAFSPDARTVINEAIPAVSASLPDIPTTESANDISTRSSSAEPVKPISAVADNEITDKKTDKVASDQKDLDSTLKNMSEMIDSWKEDTSKITDGIISSLPSLTAAAQSAHPAAGTLIEATSSATPESHNAVLNALTAIDSTKIISGSVTSADATLEDVRELSTALNGYVDAIAARGASHVQGVNDAAALAAASTENSPTYTSSSGEQKSNPNYDSGKPSAGSGGGNPNSGDTPGAGNPIGTPGTSDGTPNGSGSGTPPAPTPTTYSVEQQIANSGYGGNAINGECAALNTAYISNTNPTIGGPIGLGGARLGWAASSGTTNNSVTWYAC